MCMCTLYMCIDLCTDLIQEVHLAVDNLSLEKIWNIYIPLTLK